MSSFKEASNIVLICCSKAFYDGAWLNSASVGSLVIRFVWEGLSRVVLGVWNEILVGLQPVRALAHRRQVFDLMSKDLTLFDHPSSKVKAEDLAKDGVHR